MRQNIIEEVVIRGDCLRRWASAMLFILPCITVAGRIPDEEIYEGENGSLELVCSIPGYGEISMDIPAGDWCWR